MGRMLHVDLASDDCDVFVHACVCVVLAWHNAQFLHDCRSARHYTPWWADRPTTRYLQQLGSRYGGPACLLLSSQLLFSFY